MSMSFPLQREKALPDIPNDVDDSRTVEHEEPRLVSSPKIATTSADTSKALPSVNVENMLSGEEMCRLHALWNEAGLSAVSAICTCLPKSVANRYTESAHIAGDDVKDLPHIGSQLQFPYPNLMTLCLP